MQKVTVVWLVGLLVMSVTGQVLAQTQRQVTVADILSRPQDFVNVTVELVGEIRNPHETEVGRGTYDLCDASETCITVRTRRVPAPGQTIRLMGQVRVDPVTSGEYLYEIATPGEGGFPGFPWVLVAGGVVLAGLIVLLVVLLTKKPARPEPVWVEPGPVRPGDTEVVPTPHRPEPKPDPRTREFYGTITVEEGPDAGKSLPISKKLTIMGRPDGADCDLRLTDPTVSRPHAHILRRDDGSLQLNNVSTQQTLVNGADVDSTMLSDGDKIQMGSTVVSVKLVAGREASGETQEFAGMTTGPAAPPPGRDETQEFLGAQLEVVSGPHSGETFMLSKDTTLIGRRSNQDIVLAKDRTVSRGHCEIRHSAGEFTVVGKAGKQVLVNGEEEVSCLLADGDEIQLGGTKLRFMKL